MDKKQDSSINCHSATENQLSNISTFALNDLRGRIKDVMIPLLIKIFQLRHAREEDPHSILSSKKSEEEIISELNLMRDDIKQLQIWCQSCLTQIDKALSPVSHKEKTEITTSSTTPAAIPSFFNLKMSVVNDTVPKKQKKSLFSIVFRWPRKIQ